jgi:DNA (cytosine-5)-methyltransferase 1
MLRAIQEIKPKYVIAENVFGITNIDGGLVFEQVCLDLENEGYEVQPFIIPACAKNAPHRRDRCWFIAYSSARRIEEMCEWSGNKNKSNNATNTKSNGSRGMDKDCGDISSDGTNECEDDGTIINRIERDVTDSTSDNRYPRNGWQKFPTQSPICGGNDGFSTELDGITFSKWRAESIKGYGNAIVPQIAYSLFQIINEL